MSEDQKLLAALRRYAKSMADDYELTDVLHQLTAEVADVMDIAGAGIVIPDVDGRLRYATASNEDIATLERQQEEDQAGPCAQAFTSGEVVRVEDIGSRSDWPNYRKQAQSLGFSSVVGIPLKLRSERVGALNLYDRPVRPWTEQHLAPALVLADMAAGFMIHDRLQDVRLRAEQLQGALDSRVLIEQAKGILSIELECSVDEAFEVLRHHARNNNTHLTTVARAVVEDGLRPRLP
jgi:GAF domain-containing protein